MDRLRDMIRRVAMVATLAGLTQTTMGCDERSRSKTPPEALARFAAIPSEKAGRAATSFCERAFPASGAESRRFVVPPERKPPPARTTPAREIHTRPIRSWTWVNLWASWCAPCLEEMPLLLRWGKSLGADGIDVHFESWSIDESEEDLARALAREIPGRVRWLRASEDLSAFVESLGVTKDSAIPIHALVDEAGQLRCVRVGKVGEEAYGEIKTLLSGA